jgi:methyl-accepting chemotaxis protein
VGKHSSGLDGEWFNPDCIIHKPCWISQIAKDINDFIDEFKSFIDEISDSVARLTSYESIFSGNQRFGHALALMFSELLQYFR